MTEIVVANNWGKLEYYTKTTTSIEVGDFLVCEFLDGSLDTFEVKGEPFLNEVVSQDSEGNPYEELTQILYTTTWEDGRVKEILLEELQNLKSIRVIKR